MPEEKETKQVVLESGTYPYVHVSPFKLNAVAQKARAQYIKDELDDKEPQVPTYTVTHGGGKLPDGQELPKWEQEYDYTIEYVAELRAEYDELRKEHNEHNQYVEIPVAIQARFVDLHNALDAWDDYWKIMAKIRRHVRYKKVNAGFWLMFEQYMPDGDEWIKEQAAIGIDADEVPSDSQERFIYWFETEFISTQAEYQDLLYIVEGRESEMLEARAVARGIFQH